MDFEDIMEAEQEAFSFSGENMIDVFPVVITDATNPSKPTVDNITIQGVTIRAELWDEGDNETIQWELNHQYKSGGDCGLHIRMFPVDDNSGDFEFEYEYFILHVDGTTDIGDTVTITGSFEAGDKTANKGKYAWVLIDGTDLIDGDMLIGVFARNISTYGSNIARSEIGLHIPVGRTGQKIS